MTSMSAIKALLPFRHAAGLSLAVSLAFAAAPSAHALGLGEMELRSHLGQVFVAEVPLRLADGETLRANCVRPIRDDGGDIPGIGPASVSVEARGDGRSVLVVRSRAPVNEPVARVVIDAGCEARVVREFVLFLDPPELAAPAALAESRAAAARAAALAALGPDPAERSRATGSRAGADAGAAPKRRPPRVNAAAAPVAGKADAPVASATSGGAAPKPAARKGDRIKLVSPEDSAPIGGKAPADQFRPATLAASAASTASSEAASDAARIAAEARLAMREQELAAQVVALGKEIDELKRRAAVSVETPGSTVVAGAELPPWWAYALALVTLVAVIAMLMMVRRQRALARMIETAPWWNANAASPPPTAPMDDPYGATAPPPVDSRYVASMPVFGADTLPIEVNFPDRLGDIEVEELSGTRALNALRPQPDPLMETSRSSVLTRSSVLDLPEPDFALSATQAQDALASSVFDAAQLPPLDFDLGMPEAEMPASASIDFAPLPDVFAAGNRVATATAHHPLAPSDARHIQTRLRATVEAVEQADNYVENGQFESAAVTLNRYIDEHPDAPRAAWLMLLELYRRTDRAPAYDQLAAAFERRFGRPARPWDQAGSLDRGVGLDSNPDMLQSIWAKWGTPEAIGLLAELLEDPDADDADYFNLALQRDLLNFVKICPLDA